MVYTCLYHLKLWFLGDCLWHWVSHISNHLHMVQGRTEDDYTPDETPKTPKSARSPNNRINLPKEFPMLGWQNRQSLDFGVAKWFYCWIWSLLGKSVCVLLWFDVETCWQFRNLHACEMSRTAPVDTGVLNETLRNVKKKKGCNNVSVLVHSWIRLDMIGLAIYIIWYRNVWHKIPTFQIISSRFWRSAIAAFRMYVISTDDFLDLSEMRLLRWVNGGDFRTLNM